jgi:hypothetical protein
MGINLNCNIIALSYRGLKLKEVIEIEEDSRRSI